MLKTLFRICLFTIICSQIVVSFKVYNIDDTADLIPNLKKILDNEQAEYRKHVYFRGKSDLRRFSDKTRPFFGKSKLVSRVIPHGFKGGPYEYDSKLNTLYKPLIRFHMRKPIPEALNVSEKNSKSSDVLGYVVLVKDKKKQQNSNLRGTKKQKNTDNKKNNILGMSLAKYLRMSIHKPAISSITQMIDKSAEEEDHLQPGMIPYIDSSFELPRPTVAIPAYPFWNYWTYGKTIYQDDCEGNLVKLGNVCISPHGHRRLTGK